MDHYFLTLINGGGPLCTIQCLKAKCDEALSNFAFNFNLRRYTVGGAARRPRVLSLEGLRPLAVGGHWLPEMKALAGGVDDLQEPGAPAERLRWEQVLSYAPEVLILAPCVAWSPEQTLVGRCRLTLSKPR